MLRVPRPMTRFLVAQVSLLAILFSAQRTTFGKELLNRSIYLPVQITICEHIRQAILYRGDEALRPLPGKQVFQFSYYPNLQRLVPEAEHLNVKGIQKDGKHLNVGVVVTPTAVYIADRCMHLDYQKQLQRLRTRIDTHYDSVKIKVACDQCCRRSKEQTVSESEDH
jgi:hypothetical protein